jgi:hypothetical protein
MPHERAAQPRHAAVAAGIAAPDFSVPMICIGQIAQVSRRPMQIAGMRSGRSRPVTLWSNPLVPGYPLAAERTVPLAGYRAQPECLAR